MSLKPKVINFEEKWAEVSRVVKILMSNSQNLSRADWLDSFSLVYTLCTAPGNDQIQSFEKTYIQTKLLLESHVEKIKDELMKEDDKLLMYQDKWDKYYRGSQYVNQFYTYMNKQHIQPNRSGSNDTRYGIEYSSKEKPNKEIGEMALDVWRYRLLEPISSDIINLLMEKIKSEREGNLQRDSVIHDVIQSFVLVDSYLPEKYQLGTYKMHIENRYLDDTEEFYRDDAQKLLASHSCSEYMVVVLDRLAEEQRRCQKYLHKSSLDLVIERCSSQMVKGHLTFLQSEVSDILKNERWSDLRNMYRLFKSDKSAIEPLYDSFYQFVKERGSQQLKTLFQSSNDQNDTALAKNFVEVVLKVHGHFSSLIKDYLDSDLLFLSSLDKAFMVIVNLKEESSKTSRSSELLAKYCDFLLKKNKISETEIDEKLAMAVTVLKYIEEPDMFQKFYQRNLARRLIQNQSISMDSEESMIKQLKVACGFEFINKLNRMFTDIGISSGLNQSFSEYLTESKQNNGLAPFHIHVLSAGFWPLNHTPAVTVRIPEDIQRFVNLFKEFYDKKFTGRRLFWLHHLCSGDITMRGFKKSYIVNMSTYQFAMLSLFNRATALTAGEITLATDISQENLQKVVESMSGSGAKILTVSSPESGQFTEASVIRVNEEFSNKLVKFKLTLALQRETEKEIQQARSSVEEDRRMFLQAALVRIMKSRKSMKHNDLVQEVIRQSAGRFQPNFSNIKRAIEGLIEKAYLERNPQMNEVYEYVA